MSTGDTNSFEKIIGRLREEYATLGEFILPTPLGPIDIQHLTNIKGWTYDMRTIGYPGVEQPVVAGGPPVVLADYTDEKGWLISIISMFRSPYVTLRYISDNHNFSVSPFILNAIGMTTHNPMAVYSHVYNPATALGPLYGVSLIPVNSLPYERLIRIELSLPTASPIAATTIFAAGVSRIKITDEQLFLRSIKKFSAEQMIGKKLDRYP